MRQWFALDQAPRLAYYLVFPWLVVGAVACGTRPAPLAPSGMPSLSRAEAERWVSRRVPTRPARYELRWALETQQGSSRGRAAVQFAPPDSIRFDYRGPFGRSGAAVIVGDEVLWSRPAEDVDRLIQTAPLFWAALGIPRYAASGAAVTGQVEGETYRWRYAQQSDTLTYVLEERLGGRFRADLRSGTDVIGTVDVAFADSTLQPASARLIFPPSASIVLFTVTAIDTLVTLDAGIWNLPSP